jgi:molybdenum cofactor guanylyltransferase
MEVCMANASRILGVILAGGEGRRVGGEDKGLLPLHGKPAVEHVLSVLRPQCDEMLIVANRNQDRYARYARVTGDEVPNHAGPLAGIAAAFALVEGDNERFEDFAWLLTVPVDCPGLPPDLFARLHAALQAAPDTLCAFARDAHRLQPLFALYPLACREPLLASAREALNVHASPLRWHMELDALAVDFSDRAEAFRNLNTLEDFREYGTHA